MRRLDPATVEWADAATWYADALLYGWEDRSEPLRLLRRAHRIYERAGDPRALIDVNQSIGHLLREQLRLEEARAAYGDAREAAALLNRHSKRLVAETMIGAVLHDQGRLDEAERVLAAVVHDAPIHGGRDEGLPIGWKYRGKAALEAGALEDADRAFPAALRTLTPIVASGEATLRCYRAEVAVLAGRPRRARQLLAKIDEFEHVDASRGNMLADLQRRILRHTLLPDRYHRDLALSSLEEIWDSGVVSTFMDLAASTARLVSPHGAFLPWMRLALRRAAHAQNEPRRRLFTAFIGASQGTR